MTEYAKFFLPGPVYVRDEIKEAMKSPTIGHRSKDFSVLYERIVKGIAEILHTDGRIYLSSSTATGLMEAAVRNVVQKRSLHLICGSFGKLWYDIAKSCGKDAVPLEVEWGMSIKPDAVGDALAKGGIDSVFVTHNETSTGVINPLEEISEIVKEYDDVALIVDAVSSMAGTEIQVDDWGLDVCLASVQKGWALPPGFAVASVSARAFERSKSADNKGYYFDFEMFEKYHLRSQTISTASTPHMNALVKQLDDMLETGMENRYSSILQMAEKVRSWAEENFSLFAEEGYRSPTLTCVKNTKDINVSDLLDKLKKKGYIIGNGYGKLKGDTFRIAHMGDLKLDDIEMLLQTIDETIKEMG